MKRSPARSKEAIDFARSQRGTSNEFANTVWQWLRNRQISGQKFRREFPIPPYTADFCCVELKPVIEIDGAPHLTEEGIRRDRQRDTFLASLGYQVLRIPGYEVIRDGAAVIARIRAFVADAKAPHPPPLAPQRGEGSQHVRVPHVPAQAE